MQEALESQTGLDDSQWLTYWILSAGISIVERFLGGVLYRLPFFTEIKLIFLMWLVLPYFKGAAALYEFSRPQINKGFSVVRQNVDELKGTVGTANNGEFLRKACSEQPTVAPKSPAESGLSKAQTIS
jgi:receptor expression-enhancing protein 5/6